MTQVDEVGDAISRLLVEAERYFKPGAKLTFIMRMPGKDECEMLIGSDSLEEIDKLLERMKARANDTAGSE